MIILTKVIDRITWTLRTVAMIVVVIMMAIISVGVTARFLGSPLIGTEEIVEMFQVVLIMFSLAYVQSKDKHISIGLIVDHLSMRIQKIIDFFGYLVTAALCFVIAYVFLGSAYESYQNMELSLLVEFPYYILKYLVAFGFFQWGLESLNRIIKLFLGNNKTTTPPEKELNV